MALDLFGNEIITKKTFTESFVVNPFSILDTKRNYWQVRKKYWKRLIKDSGEERKHKLSKKTNKWNDENETYGIVSMFDVSILDPVLSEALIHWFSFPKSNVLDPFAGDTVFGFVSSFLGHNFTGIELRKEQCDFNRDRVKGLTANYINDDAANVLKHIPLESQDFLFSCPPYYDLEIYSDLPNDVSNQETYEDFIDILRKSFSDSIKTLKNNRFACIVVGDIRDKEGFYRRFPHHICEIFESNGMRLYNDLILAEMIGRKAMTANRNFITRKNPKIHQNVLVFYKGDVKKIKDIYKKLR